MADAELRLVEHEGGWRLEGRGGDRLALINDYLAYVADRRYSPATVRSYGFDLLHFARWLAGEDLELGQVTTDVLLGYLRACRRTLVGAQQGGNVVPLRSGRASGYAPATINRRLAAISGLFSFSAMRDPCWAIWRRPNLVPGCGSVSLVGCPAVWNARRWPRCWAVCAPTGTGPSPG